jgi:hypothetical protein
LRGASFTSVMAGYLFANRRWQARDFTFSGGLSHFKWRKRPRYVEIE